MYDVPFSQLLARCVLTIVCIWFGLPDRPIAGQEPSNSAPPPTTRNTGKKALRVWSSFDGGVAPPYKISDGAIAFDLKDPVLDVLLKDAPPGLKVQLQAGDFAMKLIPRQGLLVGADGVNFDAVPFTQEGTNLLTATLKDGGDVRIATRYPYGRDALEKLLCDAHGAPNLRLRVVRREHRTVPIFEFGTDDGKKRIHFLVAGECAWETAGSWTADAMVRAICSGSRLSSELLKKAVVRIVPLISPFSATQSHPSYATLDGKNNLYGAATWGNDRPPPEYAAIRDEVVKTIESGRLGLLMTIHSHGASMPITDLETIRSSGDHRLEGPRLRWAQATLEQLIQGVPKGFQRLSEKCWHAGLARDYLLKKHNAITFRMEVTTHGQGMAGFQQTGRQLLENINRITDWTFVAE